MSDPRVVRAQALHWEIEALRQLGAHHAALNVKHREAAGLLEERAREVLGQRDALGWTDLFAAVTHWAEAGERRRAEALLRFGESCVGDFPDGADSLRNELDELRAWLKGLAVVPSLSEFARDLPPVPRMAA